MKYYFFLIGLLMSTSLFAQNNTIKTNQFQAVIKGNIRNNTDKFWEFILTGYFHNNNVSVPVDDKGNFNKTIWFDGDAQDIYLYLNNDAITIYVQKNDTIEINWDAKDFSNTFRVQNTDSKRNNSLQAMITLYNKYRQPRISLIQGLAQENPADSIKFFKINDLYNQELQTAIACKATGNKILSDIYFHYSGLLQSFNLLGHYRLTIKDTTVKTGLLYFLIKNENYYKIESEAEFNISNEYRQFLFNYLRVNKSLFVAAGPGDYESSLNKIIPFSHPWTDYYTALSEFRFYKLRDWFITKSILFDFENYSFEDAQAIYKDFIPKIKMMAYSDTLDACYKDALTLKPGNVAPDFILNDIDGKPVSLKSLKGKVVFIDFWGVGCSPCMADIRNDVPKLHDKYKDKNIVFVNICVDANNTEWKNSLKETGLSGINLIAEGWNKNPVCKLYGINNIPHYFIIGADGKMVNNNSPRPSNPGMLAPQLDKLLSN